MAWAKLCQVRLSASLTGQMNMAARIRVFAGEYGRLASHDGVALIPQQRPVLCIERVLDVQVERSFLEKTRGEWGRKETSTKGGLSSTVPSTKHQHLRSTRIIARQREEEP